MHSVYKSIIPAIPHLHSARIHFAPTPPYYAIAGFVEIVLLVWEEKIL